MRHHDNQFTDAAQLVATHRAAHADTATARLAQVSPDATLVQESPVVRDTITEMTTLMVIAERNSRQKKIDPRILSDMEKELIHDVETLVRIANAALKEARVAKQALAALDADGEREG